MIFYNNVRLSTIIIDRLGRIIPRFFWTRYSNLARSQGFDKLYLLLSFDCDTPADAEASAKIDRWLVKNGIQRSYAVPGTMLETNPDIYKKIHDAGAEFLNHGYLPHTELMDGVYRSTTFYEQMDPSDVVADVRKGHATVLRVLGRPPAGFRAPHFGMVSQKTKRDVIQPVLRDLGEIYSSQSTPFTAIINGPVWRENGWPEFPVIGSANAPFSVLDSFSYLENPAIRKVSPRFSQAFRETAESLINWEINGLLNFYVDPSHVVDDPGFLDTLGVLREQGIESLTYTQAMELTSGNGGK